MKKIVYLFIALLAFACTNNAFIDTPNSLENKMKSTGEIRSYTEAIVWCKSNQRTFCRCFLLKSSYGVSSIVNLS